MAKSKKQPTGPYLAAAFFCEKMLKEADGVSTFVRMVDILTVPKPDDLPVGPDGQPPLAGTMITAVVSFKSGNATGEKPAKLVANFPSGRQMDIVAATPVFLGGEKGASLYVHMPVPVTEEGLYWYDVILDGETVTRMPLRIIYREPSPAPAPPPSTEPESAEAPAQRRRRQSGPSRKKP